MPEESRAAEEHALMAEVGEPHQRLAAEPPSLSAEPEFPVVLRGYDRLAVDAYVRRMTELVADLQGRHSPDAAVRRALERVGEEVSGILQRAHDTAAALTVDSRREAEDRLETARREAEELSRSAAQEAEAARADARREAAAEIAGARQEAERIVADARDRLVELDADADRVWGERERIVDDVRSLAQELAGIAEAAASRFPPAAPAAAAATEPGADATVAFDSADTVVAAPFDAEAANQSVGAEDPDATRPLPPATGDA